MAVAKTRLSTSPVARSRRKLKRMHAFDYVNYALMLVFTLLVLYPFWQVAVLSFSNVKETTALGAHLWPKAPSLAAYEFLFSYDAIVRPYVNSIVRTLAGTAIELAFTLLAAYPLAKRDLPWRGWITTYFIVPMFFTGGLIPTYLLIRSLGLIDNFFVLILPTAVSIFSIIIMRNYFMALDQALEESAVIDGAGYWTLLARIVVPVSVPVLATIGLWAAVGHWNAWFDAMIYIRNRDWTVIQAVMREMLQASNEQANDLAANQSAQQAQISLANVRAAIALLSIGPIVLAYPWVQRYFVRGIMLGSLKG